MLKLANKISSYSTESAYRNNDVAKTSVYVETYAKSFKKCEFPVGTPSQAKGYYSRVEEGDPKVLRVKDVCSYKSYILSKFHDTVPVLAGNALSRSERVEQLLTEKYELVNSKEVLDFVLEKPILVGFLLAAKQKIASFFDDPVLELEYTEDPEVVGWDKLWIKILVQVNPDSNCEVFEKATENLNRLDDHWWLNTPYSIRKLLSVDLRFIEIQ